MATNNPRIRYDIEAGVTGEQDVNALARELDKLAETLEGDLKTQAQASAQALRELGAKQGAIDNFVKLKTEAGEAGKRLRETQAAAQNLSKAIAASGVPTRTQAVQMEKLREAVRSAKVEYVAKTAALDNGRRVLATYGITSNTVAQGQRATRQAISEVRAEVTKLAPAYAAAGNAAVAAGKKQVQGAQAVQTGLSGIGETLRSIQNIAMVAVGGTFLTSMAREVGEVADQYANLRARISLVTGDGPALEAAFDAVRQIAIGTNSALETTADLFTRVYRAGKEVGLSQQQALELTQTINQAIQVSGGSAQAADAAITQLIQGLQSGVLRGEEFNSVMEQAPRLAQALAAGLGVTIGQLRALAQEGKLTSEVVLTALQGQAQTVAEEFAKLPPTIGRALTNLSTNWSVYVGEVDRAMGASQAAAAAINGIAGNLDAIAGMATRAGAVLAAALAVQAAGALRTYIAEVTAARTATSLLALQMSQIPKTLQIAVAFTGFEVGFQIGDLLYNKFETVRKLGVGMVHQFDLLISRAQYLYESAAAIFTDDTIAAAFERYQRRLASARMALEGSFSAIDQGIDQVDQANQRMESSANDAAAAQTRAAAEAKKASDEKRAAAALEMSAVEGLAIARRVDADIELQQLQTKRLLAEQSEQMALALGDEKLAIEARVQQMEIDIAISEARIKVIQVEAENTIALAEAKLAEASASGELDPAKQAELEGSIRLAKAKLEEADAQAQGLTLLQRNVDRIKDAAKSGANYKDVLDQQATANRRAGQAAEDAGNKAKEAGDKAREAGSSGAEGADLIKDAFGRAGITMQKDLEAAAIQAARDFELIKSSGQANADGLAKAWRHMAEAQIAANGGMASEALQAEAAMHGFRIEVDETGKAIIKNMHDARGAVDDFTKGLEKAAAAAKRLKELQGYAAGGGDLSDVPTEDLEKGMNDLLKEGGALSSVEYRRMRNELMSRRKPTTDKQGFAADESGNRIAMGGDLNTLTGIAAFLKSAGIDDDATARRIAMEFSDGKGNIPYFSNPGQKRYGGDTISMALLRAAERVTFGASPVGGANVPGVPTSVPKQGARDVNFNLSLNGESYGTVDTSEQGQAVMNRFLDELQRGKMRSTRR